MRASPPSTPDSPTSPTSPTHRLTDSPTHRLTDSPTSPSHRLTVSPSHRLTVSPSHRLTVSPSNPAINQKPEIQSLQSSIINHQSSIINLSFVAPRRRRIPPLKPDTPPPLRIDLQLPGLQQLRHHRLAQDGHPRLRSRMDFLTRPKSPLIPPTVPPNVRA